MKIASSLLIHVSGLSIAGVSNIFGAVGHIYALKIFRGPDNFARNDTIDIFIIYS